MTLDSAGTVTPDTALEVTGMRIGTVPVSLTPDGLVVGGSAHAVPAGPTVNELLAPSKITVEVVAAQRHPDRVVAPALRLVFPVDASPSGQGPSMMTAFIGYATVLLNGEGADVLGPLPPVDPGDSGSPTPPADTSGGAPAGGAPVVGPETGPGAASGADPAWSGGGAAGPVSGGGSFTAPVDPGDSAASAPTAVAAPATPVVGIARIGAGFDLDAIYVTLAASSVGLLILSVLIRELGVRHP